MLRSRQFSMTALQRHEDALLKDWVKVRREVIDEFRGQQFDNPNVVRVMHGGCPETSHVYGGKMSATPQEMQLVQAWRRAPSGQWELGTCVVHRVHSEDDTLTVQFLPDQHRSRLHVMSVKPLADVTPEYPEMRLAPGERLPTWTELLVRERAANEMRQRLGIGPDVPLPGTQERSLRVGEARDTTGAVAVQADHWGISAPTLDALRNRSIPGCQVGGEYGPHFYTDLYRNNFYSGKGRLVSNAGHVGVGDPRRKLRGEEPHYISHRYIPLEGPELEQDMRTGSWRTTCPAEGEGAEAGKDWPFPSWMWFLG